MFDVFEKTIKEREMEEKKTTFELTDDHVKQISEAAAVYNRILTQIGSDVVDLLSEVDNAKSLRKTIEAIQESICTELEIPRSKKTIWNIGNKIVEISG